MARPSSKIMTAGELRTQKAALKVEIRDHSAAVEAAEKTVSEAKKTLASATKTADATFAKAGKDHAAAIKAADATFAKAGKDHLAALKEASKAFDVVQKAQEKIIASGNKASAAAATKVAALAPTGEPA